MAHTPETRLRAAYKIRLRRVIWLAENGPCRFCGSSELLEVDHIDPTTKVSHRIWSWSDARRLVELSKCQVLCRSCHEKKTAAENSVRLGGLKHGTAHMYRKGGCRCDLCMEYRRRVKRADYAKKKLKLVQIS